MSRHAALDEVTGPGLLISMWRYRRYVTLAVFLAAAAALGHASTQPRVYEAVSTVLLSDPNRPSVIGDGRPSNVEPFTYASTQAVLVSSSPVVAKASELLASPITPSEMEGVTVEPQPDVLMLRIRVRHTDARRAAALADALPAAYDEFAATRLSDTAKRTLAELATARSELEAVLKELDSRLADATSRGAQAEIIALQSQRFSVSAELSDVASSTRRVTIDSAVFGSGVDQREQAVLSAGPISPRPLRDTVLAGLFGLLLSSGAAWAVNTRRVSNDERRSPEKVLGAPLVGEIPEIPELPDRDDHLVPMFARRQSEEAEAFRFLAAAVTLCLPGGGRTLLVTSAGEGEGKSVTSLNVALALAQPGRSVVLLDANPVSEGIRPLLGTLSGGVFDQTTARGGGGYQWTPQDRAVSFRVVGLPGQPEQTSSAVDLLEELRASADVVVVDAPALFRVAAVTELASRVDSVLLVVPPRTDESVLTEVRRQLDLAGSPILGYVRNRVRPRADDHRDANAGDGPPVDAGEGSWALDQHPHGLGTTEISKRERMRAGGASTAGP